MQITVQKLPKSAAKLTIELTDEELAKYRSLTSEQLSKKIKIPGFREGKAPLEVVEKQVGHERFASYVLENALSRSYAKAVVDEKLNVATSPKVEIKNEKPLKYEAEVALMPEATVKDYKNIKIPKENAEVQEKELEEAMKDFQKYYATLKQVERPVKKGDRVEIDFEGTDMAGTPLEGTRSKNHPLIVGEGMMLTDFEENLVEMKKDETKSFNVTFPKDYHHKPFQGKVVNFKVAVRRIEEVMIPEISEAFIEQVTGTKMTTDELKERFKKNIHAEKENAARMKREDKFLEQALKQVEVELPDMLIGEEVEYMTSELKSDLEKKGMDLKKYLEKLKKDEKDLQKEMHTEAEKRLKLRFALQFLFKEEKIEVSDPNLEKEIEKLIRNFPENEQEKVRTEYQTSSGRARLRNRLMLYHLFEKLVHSQE